MIIFAAMLDEEKYSNNIFAKTKFFALTRSPFFPLVWRVLVMSRKPAMFPHSLNVTQQLRCTYCSFSSVWFGMTHFFFETFGESQRFALG
jgi:hypothetical protein